MRYFLVSVPDDEASFCLDGMEELEQIHGAVISEATRTGADDPGLQLAGIETYVVVKREG